MVRVRSFCLWRFWGVSDGLVKHLIGGQHRSNEQQGDNYRPGKPGGGEDDAEESGQRHCCEPKDGVPLEQVFLFGVFHVLCFSGFDLLERCVRWSVLFRKHCQAEQQTFMFPINEIITCLLQKIPTPAAQKFQSSTIPLSCVASFLVGCRRASITSRQKP